MAAHSRRFPEHRHDHDDDYNVDIDTTSLEEETDKSEELSGDTKEVSEELKALIDDNSFREITELFAKNKKDDLWVRQLMNMKRDGAFSDDDERFHIRSLVNKSDRLKDTLTCLSTRQLIGNREGSFGHHLRLVSVPNPESVNILAREFSQIKPELCEFAWCTILNNLPYIVSFKNKAPLNAVSRILNRYGGECEIVNDDLYHEAYDAHHKNSNDFYVDMARAMVRHNFELRHFYTNHVQINSVEHVAETAREIAALSPEWDEYSLREILRNRLPFTLNCETRSQANKIVSIIRKHEHGEAELHI